MNTLKVSNGCLVLIMIKYHLGLGFISIVIGKINLIAMVLLFLVIYYIIKITYSINKKFL